MRRENIGKCMNCGATLEKKAMTSHIIQCTKTAGGKGREEQIIQVFIEAEGMPEYWLYAEGKAGATFQELDDFLRKIWLECCNHLSGFYEMRNQIPKSTTFLDYFIKEGIKFRYKYDFGTTTALIGKSINRRKGSIGKQAIRLLAQNATLKLICSECEKPAELVCPYCKDVELTLFCAAHAEKHKCASDETFLPVVNSPRMGVCRYTGES